MNAGITKLLIRTLGVVVALMGALIVVCGVRATPAMLQSAGWGGFILLGFSLAIGGYITYTGYTAWRSLSPVAVRNIVGLAAFILLSFCFWLLDGGVARSEAREAFRYFICVGGGYLAARFAGERIVRSLWPNT
jgi:hypothetical protein